MLMRLALIFTVVLFDFGCRTDAKNRKKASDTRPRVRQRSGLLYARQLTSPVERIQDSQHSVPFLRAYNAA